MTQHANHAQNKNFGTIYTELLVLFGEIFLSFGCKKKEQRWVQVKSIAPPSLQINKHICVLGTENLSIAKSFNLQRELRNFFHKTVASNQSFVTVTKAFFSSTSVLFQKTTTALNPGRFSFAYVKYLSTFGSFPSQVCLSTPTDVIRTKVMVNWMSAAVTLGSNNHEGLPPFSARRGRPHLTTQKQAEHCSN